MYFFGHLLGFFWSFACIILVILLDYFGNYFGLFWQAHPDRTGDFAAPIKNNFSGGGWDVYTTKIQKFTKKIQVPYTKNPSDFDCSGLFVQVLLRTFIAPNVPILSDVLPEPHPPRKIIFYRGSRIAGPVRVGLPKKSKNITEKSKRITKNPKASPKKPSRCAYVRLPVFSPMAEDDESLEAPP